MNEKVERRETFFPVLSVAMPYLFEFDIYWLVHQITIVVKWFAFLPYRDEYCD